MRVLLKVTQEAYRQCKEKNRKSKTNFLTKISSVYMHRICQAVLGYPQYF